MYIPAEKKPPASKYRDSSTRIELYVDSEVSEPTLVCLNPFLCYQGTIQVLWNLHFVQQTLTSLASNNVHFCIFPIAILSGQVHFKYGNIRYFSSPKTRTVWHEIVIWNIKGVPSKPLTNGDDAYQEKYFTLNQILYFPKLIPCHGYVTNSPCYSNPLQIIIWNCFFREMTAFDFYIST